MNQANDSLPIGVVIERREIESRWADHSWRPVSIIPGAPPVAEWKEIRTGEGWVQFHAATLPLEIFGKETEGYRVNLANNPPVVYVVLRPGEEVEDNEVEPMLVTVCPFEANSYEESGDEIVEGIPMPPDILAWLQKFVDDNHVEEPFKKRKRKKAFDPRKGGGEMRPKPRAPADGF
ncbi:MAG: DUF3305 domain-containing protein [Magnetovibrionaceae bacterium]